MKCPVDNETLLMTSRNGVEIDYCPKCRGVWLDRGELDKIIDKSASADEPTPPVILPEPLHEEQAAFGHAPPARQSARLEDPRDVEMGYRARLERFRRSKAERARRPDRRDEDFALADRAEKHQREWRDDDDDDDRDDDRRRSEKSRDRNWKKKKKRESFLKELFDF